MQSIEELQRELNPRRSRFKSWAVLIVIILVVYGGCSVLTRDKKEIVVIEPEEVIVEQVIVEEAQPKEQVSTNIKIHSIVDGDLPADIFANVGGLSANEIQDLITSAADVYDFTNIKIGKDLRFIFREDDANVLEKIEYVRDTESIITAIKSGEGFAVEENDIPYEVELVTARGTINNSLYADALKADIQEATVIEMADILAFDVNFFVDVQPGNQFVVHYEKRTLDGERGPDGRIFAARYVSDKGTSEGFYFDSGDYGGYYDVDGHELRKQFLQAPLSYKRISSGYTGARLHPITGTVMAHYQIDYAAPTGTPVVSTANGVVASAGWEGGWGNIVRVKHENGYTTHYAHLSRFAKGMRSGTRVSQGQVVGFVGNTGWSTGPHLDYGMRLNGAPVNPLTLKQPKGEPLAQEQLPAFHEKITTYRTALDQN